MQVSPGLLSSRVAYAKSGKGWTTLSLGDVTAHGRFQVSLVERILYPGYPGGMLSNKVLHGEAPHQGQAAYPFYIQLTENVPLSHT